VSTTPSLFWRRLNQRHGEQLNQFGYENVKRHQAFRYFTWSWRWYTLPWNRHFRFLVTHTSPGVWLKAARERQDLDSQTWDQLPGNRAHRWLNVFATRLLWVYASTTADSAVMAVGEPLLGNPPPITWGGQLISQDLANSALETSAIRRAMKGSDPGSIVEVGAGYGRTGHALLSIYPNAKYTVVDVEPALSLSRWYLTTLFPDRDLTFLIPEEATPERLGRVDLSVSISSLQEMTREQVDGYITLFDSITDKVVFLKQWKHRTNWSDRIAWKFSKLALPPRWRLEFWETSPVQTDFAQAAWSIQTEQ
jgi:putative sugar O-methyltransferase